MTLRGILSDRLHQSALGVLVVLVVTVAYLFSAVLDVPLTHRPRHVTVQMAATGGLFEGSAVTYRGVKVGRVQRIRLTDDGVEATISLTRGGDRIPADARAVVRSLSPVGEQYLDFQPSSGRGPYLADGDVVPATATDLPKSLASTVVAVDGLLDQVDARRLHTLLTELDTGLSGTGDDLGRLVDRADLVLADLDRHWPQTARLIDDGSTVLDIAPAKADELRTLARQSRALATFLRDYDPRLRQLLHDAPGQLQTLGALLDDVAEVLPPFLRAGVAFSDVFRSYEPQLRALLEVYAPGLGVLGDAVQGGYLQVIGIPQRNVRCMYGTPVRAPTNPTRRALVTDGRCPADMQRYQRGANHAPGPVR